MLIFCSCQLTPLTGDPDLAEIIVLDDEPPDRTAAAGRHGVAVVAARRSRTRAGARR
jgi:hypothetical protein